MKLIVLYNLGWKMAILLRNISLTLLLLASSTAHAWELIFTFSDSNAYVSPESFRANGLTRSFWIMEKYYSRESDGALRRHRQYEYECNRMRYRVLLWSNWSAHGPEGTLINQGGRENSHRWYDVQLKKGTFGERLHRYACGTS
jgi:hypothetical protein